MFSLSKILLPVDFSPRSLGAARYAEALADRYGAQVTMLHVIPPPQYDIELMEAAAIPLTEMSASRKAAAEVQNRTFLNQELPGFQPQRRLLEGDPAREIVQIAHNEGFNLILMPTHGYGLFRRFILGSVTAKVLHDADCPVWTGVHLEEAPPVESIQFRTVVAAVDLGKQSGKALAWAAGFAQATKARLVIAHATPSMDRRTGEFYDPVREDLAKDAEKRIAELQKAAGTSAEVVIESGDAPYFIESVAKKQRADLVVIGRGAAAGIFGRLRANAYAIIRQSPCPVVSV
jgi:nucleotide-binding universal stress UspA family protein